MLSCWGFCIVLDVPLQSRPRAVSEPDSLKPLLLSAVTVALLWSPPFTVFLVEPPHAASLFPSVGCVLLYLWERLRSSPSTNCSLGMHSPPAFSPPCDGRGVRLCVELLDVTQCKPCKCLSVIPFLLRSGDICGNLVHYYPLSVSQCPICTTGNKIRQQSVI